MIALHHLLYFIAAAEHGSFRKAGRALGIHESVISRRVRDLEDELGASLFQRHPGGVSLSLAGSRFLGRARDALRLIDNGAKDVAAVGRSEEGHVRIGIFSSLASGFLPELLRAYAKEHPAVSIDLIDGDRPNHVAAIRQFRLDVGFVAGTAAWDECQTELLWFERVFAVLQCEHPLASREELRWCDLSEERFIVSDTAPGPEIRDFLIERFGDLGRSPKIHSQHIGRDNILSLVALDRGITIISEAMTVAQFPDIAYRPVADEILRFSAVWSPQNDNPAARRLLSLARSMARSRQAAVADLDSSSSASPSQSPDLSQ